MIKKSIIPYAVFSAAFLVAMLPALPVSAAKSEPTVIVEETAEEEHEEEKEIVIAQVDNYVNIRSTPSLDGEIVGKLYNNSIGTVLEHGEWILIESGNVKGYVRSEERRVGKECLPLCSSWWSRFPL